MRRVWMVTIALLVSSLGAPAAARADLLLSPFVGATFGGAASAHKPAFGGAVTFVGRSIGLEIEAGRTNDFFGAASPGVNVTNLSASIVTSARLRGHGLKPYFLVGAGLLRSDASGAAFVENVHYNDFALDIAVGAHVLATPHFGVRGEVRYFRRLERASDNGIVPIASNFDFWRAVVGFDALF